MFSAQEPDRVLSELGDKFPQVVWAVEVERGGPGTTAIHYTPIQPVLPDIDLATDLPDDERGSK